MKNGGVMPGADVAVRAEPPSMPSLAQTARKLAAELALPCWTDLDEPLQTQVDLLLAVTESGLELRVLRGPENLRGGHAIRADLLTVDGLSPQGRSLRQPLARAVGLFRRDPAAPFLRVVDATAGWGQDTWLLACLGCHVLAVERHPLVARMLCDGLERAARVQPQLAQQVRVMHGDAQQLLARLADVTPEFAQPDVVYLDPMFPSQRKTAERKPLRVLRRLVGDDSDSGQLLAAALHAARRRVVVKRPLHAPRLTDLPPTSVHRGKALRYDVYAAAQGKRL